jgi:hypothetical protein
LENAPFHAVLIVVPITEWCKCFFLLFAKKVWEIARDVVFRGRNVVFPLQSEENDGFGVDEIGSWKMKNQNLSTWKHRDVEKKLEGVFDGNEG